METLIFIYLLIFPFGKLLGLWPDFIILGIAIVGVFKLKLRPNGVLIVFLFSLVFSSGFLKFSNLLVGFLYLVRLASYFLLGQVVFEIFGKRKKGRAFIFNSLILVGCFIGFFGLIQYFLFPDLRALKMWGWDDHYFRLTSTFLDPAFGGILLVLTEILVVIRTIGKRTLLNYLLCVFIMITILLTYSRASYLAFGVGMMVVMWRFREKLVLILMVIFGLLIFVLPQQASEGTDLARTYSISQKLINYEESLKVIAKSPVFGIGFNNLCAFKEKYLGEKNISSHTCSGLDNGVLMIVATTGIVGLMVLIKFMFELIEKTRKDVYGWGLVASLAGVFIHGMFTNTFFYSFVLGWLALLVGISRKKIKD